MPFRQSPAPKNFSQYVLGSSLVWQQCGFVAFTRECGFSTIVWLLLSKQSEKSGIPPSSMLLQYTLQLDTI